MLVVCAAWETIWEALAARTSKPEVTRHDVSGDADGSRRPSVRHGATTFPQFSNAGVSFNCRASQQANSRSEAQSGLESRV
jgi:hypothetical protein